MSTYKLLSLKDVSQTQVASSSATIYSTLAVNSIVGTKLDISAAASTYETLSDASNKVYTSAISASQENQLSLSTGLYFGGIITKVDSTHFSISATRGWVIDSVQNGEKPIYAEVNFPSTSSITDTYVSAIGTTYILLTSANTVLQQNSYPTPDQRRNNIFLGWTVHSVPNIIASVVNSPDIMINEMSQTRDMFTAIRYVNQGIYPYANDTNMFINVNTGSLYGLGINWQNNKYSPSKLVYAGATLAQFQYRLQNDTAYSNVSAIDPTNYDVGGVLTAVPGLANTSTNQRIYFAPSGQIRIQPGQQTYSSLANAIAGAINENFVTAPTIATNLQLIGVLSVRKGATNLSSSTDAKFIPVSKFGELTGATGGVATTTLQQAYDNSTLPQITIVSASPFQLKGYDNQSTVLSILNSAGTPVSNLNADGSLNASGGSFTSEISATSIKMSSSLGFTSAVGSYAVIFVNTVSGNDNLGLILNGGGASGDATRNAYISIRGNQKATVGGSVLIAAGIGTEGAVVINTNNTERFRVTSAGVFTLNGNTSITGTLSASSTITGSTLIGNNLTASTLVYSNASKNIVSLANADGFLKNTSGVLSYDSTVLVTSAGDVKYLSLTSGGTVSSNVNVIGNISASGTIYGYTLSSPGDSFTLSNSAGPVLVVASSSVIRPNANGVVDLGTASYYFNNLYANSIKTNGIVLNGTLSASSTITCSTLIGNNLTASTFIYSNASKNIVSLANATGQLTNNGSGTFSYVATLPLTGGTLTGTIIAPQYGQTVQSSALTSGAISFALGSGASCYLTTALTSSANITVSAPAVGSTSYIGFIQGASAQIVTLLMSGVTFKQTGTTTSTSNSLVVANISTVNASYKLTLYWPTATLCYVTVQ